MNKATRSTIIVGVIFGFFISTSMQPAAAAVFNISGTVRDNLSRALPGVLVSDGTQTVTTNSSGVYSLPEFFTGGYTITAQKTGLITKSQSITVTVPTNQTVNLSLAYAVVGSISLSYISTASASAVSTLTMSSIAPGAGTSGSGSSCIDVVDSRTAVSGPATYVSTSSGVSTWTYALSLAEATPEGSFSLSYSVKECPTGVLLSSTSPGSVTYVIDNTAPTISDVLPRNRGNTIFVSQPLIATIDDTLSGIDASSIVFTLEDVTAATTATYSGSSVSYNGLTHWAKTAVVTLTLGHIYRLSVAANDRAANSTNVQQDAAADGGGFLVTSVTVDSATGYIPPVACTVASSPDQTGNKPVTCSEVPLHIGASQITLSGSRHGDEGFVTQTVSLATAKFRTTVGGLPVETGAFISTDPGWSPKNPHIGFPVAKSLVPQTIVVPQENVTIAGLNGWVPSTWTSATLFMGSASLGIATTAGTMTCADPSALSAGSQACQPDPVATPWVFWDPSVSTHVSPCDALLSHKESVAVQPEGALPLVVQVSSASPTVVSLLYSINDGATVVLSTSGTGSGSYTLSIPSGTLHEGDELSYVFQIAGTFSPASCAGVGAAVLPSNHSFRSRVTSNISKVNDRLLLSMHAALRSSAEQPGYSYATDPAALCSTFLQVQHLATSQRSRPALRREAPTRCNWK